MAKVKINASQKAKIKRAIKALNDVREDIQSQNPEHNINWFLEDCGNFNLMEDQSHDDQGNARQDRVILHCALDESAGGGW